MSEVKTVAIVEDDAQFAEFLRKTCVELGAEVAGIADEPLHAIKMIEEKLPQYLLMNARLGGRRDSVNIALYAHEQFPDLKIVFLNDSNDLPTIGRINQDHPYRILAIPVSRDDLAKALAT